MTSLKVSTEHVLQMGGGFTLPLQAVTETFAILAKRGAGKTTCAVVLTEELLAAGQQVIVVDPVGVWFGLRSGIDGTGAGLPVVIVGGDHADLPLEETAGRVLARLLVDERQSAVLDLSRLSKAASRRLMADFLEELYRANRAPLHLVVDEADLLAPQRLPREMTRLLGAMDDVVRRGRAHGLGVTLISQRPAVLSKDILGQAEVLITLRMTNPRDVTAIDEWVRLHADEHLAKEVKASLPSLPIGTAWVWSPGWLECLERVRIRQRHTFDSSATPKAGTITRTPRMLKVDVDGLRQRLAEQLPNGTAAAGKDSRGTVQALQSRIYSLTDELAAQRARPARIERVPVLDEDGRAALADALAGLTAAQDQLTTLIDGARRVLGGVPLSPEVPPAPARSGTGREPAAGPTLTPDRNRLQSEQAPLDSPLKAGALRMLQAMAVHHPVRLSRAQVATLAGMKVTGGTFTTYLSALRSGRHVLERDRLLELTARGLDTAGVRANQAPASAADLRERWRSALKAGARRMFDEIIHTYPGALSRRQLAEAVDMEPTGGTFGTYLSTLRRNGLIEVSGDQIRACDVLFLDAVAESVG